jgi:CHAD domain-containing protein
MSSTELSQISPERDAELAADAPRGSGETSRAYRFGRDEDSARGVRRIALGRANKALQELALAEGGHHATAVHAARKDLKKLRALLRLVREELGEKTFREENQRYRDIGRLLAASRDTEAKLETLSALERHFGRDFLAAASQGWREALQRERQLLADGATPLSRQPIAQAISRLRDGHAGISDWPLGADPSTLIEAGLRWSHTRGRRAMTDVLEDASAENVHAWRKRAKDLFYQLRIVQDAWPAVIGESVNQTHALADLLGEHHDLAVLREDLRIRTAVPHHKTLTALIRQREAEHLEQALTLGKRIYAEKPSAFARRHASYWDIWRTT